MRRARKFVSRKFYESENQKFVPAISGEYCEELHTAVKRVGQAEYKNI